MRRLLRIIISSIWGTFIVATATRAEAVLLGIISGNPREDAIPGRVQTALEKLKSLRETLRSPSSSQMDRICREELTYELEKIRVLGTPQFPEHAIGYPVASRIDPRDTKDLVYQMKNPDRDRIVANFVAYRMNNLTKAAILKSLEDSLTRHITLLTQELDKNRPSKRAEPFSICIPRP